MTRRKAVAFALISIILAVRIAAERAVLTFGSTLLLPVDVAKIDLKGTAKLVRLRYRTLLSPQDVSESGGIILVAKNKIGAASFVSLYNPQIPLRPREYVLRYRVVFGEKPAVRFGADKITVPAAVSAEKTAYAVVKVSKSGKSALIGLADANGTVLFKNRNAP